jgi:hypothetical protein
MSLRISDLRLISVVVASVALVATTQNSEIRIVPYPGHLFTIRLEADKQAYRLGEPIKLRASITNVSGQPYSILYWPPPAMLPLLILDSHGTQVSPTTHGVIERISGSYQLAPGETVSLGWVEISRYGYALIQPGSYTITTSLCGVGNKRTSRGVDSFMMKGEERSNPVRIRILP